MPIFRYTPTWNGFVGAPGYTNFHFLAPEVPSQADLDAIGSRTRTFFLSATPDLPNVVGIGFPGTVDQLNVVTGALEAQHTIAVPAAVVGAGAGKFANAVGSCVTWTTSLVINGHRLRGRTFLVPMSSGGYDTDGTIDATFRSRVLAAAEIFRQAAGPVPLAVWHKPSPASPVVGVAAMVSGARMTDRTAVLRSRRD
jgi:hypothetical protein